jgi:hypothetical protein
MAGDDRLGRNRDVDVLLVPMLAAGRSREEVAQSAGVSVRTVYRRLTDPSFVERVDFAREELIALSTARLAAGALAAVETIVELLQVGTPPAVRLGAARSLLEQAQRWRTAEEIEIRLAAIEANMATQVPALRGSVRIAR